MTTKDPKAEAEKDQKERLLDAHVNQTATQSMGPLLTESCV